MKVLWISHLGQLAIRYLIQLHMCIDVLTWFPLTQQCHGCGMSFSNRFDWKTMTRNVHSNPHFQKTTRLTTSYIYIYNIYNIYDGGLRPPSPPPPRMGWVQNLRFSYIFMEPAKTHGIYTVLTSSASETVVFAAFCNTTLYTTTLIVLLLQKQQQLLLLLPLLRTTTYYYVLLRTTTYYYVLLRTTTYLYT